MTTTGPARGLELSAREQQVLALVAQHRTNAEIADALYISVRTVESHVSALLRKLGAPDRRSLARYAETQDGARVAGVAAGLPLPVTPFIGRHAERAELAAALSDHRMVTAVGPGGVGKTRLALSVAAELAADRRDGAWFVDLVHVRDPAMVAAAIAETVGVAEQRSASIEAALVAALSDRDTLIVLDNCEHVLDGVRDFLERVLARCPHVTVLATSRSRLLVPYERVYPVPGLSVTDDGGDAVDLFLDRVGASGDPVPPDIKRIAHLCRALDGMALAIELAAARYPTLGLDGLEAGLTERLRFLASGAGGADRHGSLRNAIAWSYELLRPDDRALLLGVAMFASWFTVDAANEVAAPDRHRAEVADGLARLAESSLLVVQRGDPTLYRALETIRQYGVEQLEEDGQLDALRARHADWARSVVADLDGAPPDEAWCERFDRFVDDVRTALIWSVGEEHRRHASAQLASHLAGLLFVRGRPQEAQARYEQAAQLVPEPREQARFLRQAAGAAASRYAGNEALRLHREAAKVAAWWGDPAGAARDLAWMSLSIIRNPGIMADKPTADEAAGLLEEAQEISDGSSRAEAAIAAASAYLTRSDPSIVELSERAVTLARRAEDSTLESAALDQLCAVHLARQDLPAAAAVIHRREQLIAGLRPDATAGFELTDFYVMAADVSLAAGDLVKAGGYADRLALLPFYRDEDHLAITRRIKVDALAGNFESVLRAAERFRLGWERAGRPSASDLAAAASAVSMVYGMLGDDEQHHGWRHMILELGVSPERLSGSASGWGPTFDALLALHRDDAEAVLNRLTEDVDESPMWDSWGPALWRPWYAALWVEASVLGGHAQAAEGIDRARNAARFNPIATAMVDRAEAIATSDTDNLERLAVSFGRLACPYQEARTRALASRLRDGLPG